MKKHVGNERLMLKACHLYYDEDLRQEDIARRLGISRPTVSRLLKDAKTLGVVKIQIISPFVNDYSDLEKRLEDQFKLKYVVVVDDKDDNLQQNAEVAKGAAAYLAQHLRDNDIVGLSMGTTLQAIPQNLEGTKAKNLTFVPLIGGIGRVEIEIHPNRIVTETAEACGGKYILLHAPALLSNPATLESLKEEAAIKSILSLIERVNVAVVGIGRPLHGSSTMNSTGYFSTSDFEEMKQGHAVGDICMQVFDEQGNGEPFSANKRVLGISLNQLRNIENVVAVAGGQHKVESIRAAIKGQYVNILVTNHSNAIALLES